MPSLVAKETLLPLQQAHTLITLLFEAISSSYLVQLSLMVIQTHAITSSQEILVTMATSAYLKNFSVWNHIKFVPGKVVPWGNPNSCRHWLLRKSSYHDHKNIRSKLWCLISCQVHIASLVPWGNTNSHCNLLPRRPSYDGSKHMNPISPDNFKKYSMKVIPNINILKILVFRIHTRETWEI